MRPNVRVLAYADERSPGTVSLAPGELLRRLNDLFDTRHEQLGWAAWREWEILAAPALLDRDDLPFDLELWRRAMGLDEHGGQTEAARLLGVRREQLYRWEARQRPVPPSVRLKALDLLRRLRA